MDAEQVDSRETILMFIASRRENPVNTSKSRNHDTDAQYHGKTRPYLPDTCTCRQSFGGGRYTDYEICTGPSRRHP